VALYELAGGEVVIWVEPDGPIMIKTKDPRGDPVELTEEEALDIAETLNLLVGERLASSR
jgi:hypothetical protein